eukprot:scaffold193592_cov46-Prasinocladus_malaysianus.AAC.1
MSNACHDVTITSKGHLRQIVLLKAYNKLFRQLIRIRTTCVGCAAHLVLPTFGIWQIATS